MREITYHARARHVLPESSDPPVADWARHRLASQTNQSISKKRNQNVRPPGRKKGEREKGKQVRQKNRGMGDKKENGKKKKMSYVKLSHIRYGKDF